MKITRYLTAALCILSAASCTKELMGPDVENGPVEVVLEAFPGDESPETKTVLGSDGKSVLWEAGDQISLFFGNGENGGSCFTTADGGETASFTGSINAFTAGGEGYTGETTYFWGVYPYKSTTTCDNNSITINIPSIQPGKAGTFAPGVNISVGRSENLKMGFYNVCSGFNFTVGTGGITELVLKSTDGTSIVGDATVQFVSGKPAVVKLENGSDEVRIIPEKGEFVVGKKYYLEFIPVVLNGITITLYNSENKEATYENTAVLDFKRGIFKSITGVEGRVGEWTVRKGNISFADPNFKAYCVENFDTDGDGEVSFAEAAVVNSIYCEGLGITSMDEIRYFTSLTTLNCSSNQLTSLNVSNNAALEILSCSYNHLTSLDVSKNTALTRLWCHRNQLTSLDVSNNAALTTLDCWNNQLTTLDVSNNTASALTSLDCCFNQLTSLDVSKNTVLTSLVCYNNKLAILDVSKNTALTDLDCHSNQLTSLDVSNNTALTDLYCFSNQLTSLDVSKNTALMYLGCSGNQLTSLDVSKNTALEYLSCSYNQLTSLDVSKNTALTRLYCNCNQLTSLDVSKNTALTNLWCQYNQLTNLDVSKNTALTTLLCSPMNNENGQNLLKTLYIYNGQEIDGITTGRSSDYIPDETVITDADPGTNEGVGEEDLDGNGNINFADPNFKAYCVENFDTNGDGEVSFVEAAVVESIDCSGTYYEPGIITSLDGIQYFTSLMRLSCHYNQLTTLDVSKNTTLTYLNCNSNKLTSLDASGNTALRELGCFYNQLTSLDVSGNTALTDLQCYSNQLTSLDVSNNTALTSLYCYSNQLSSLDVSRNTALKVLDCDSNQLTSLDVSKNTALGHLRCGSNQLTSLDVSNNTALTSLFFYENQLTSLDVSKNTALTGLSCGGNQLTSLDVSNNTALTHLYCDSNQLTSLDVSKNTALECLHCYSNQLSSLDVSRNTALTRLDCSPMKDENGQNLLQTLYISSGQTITIQDIPSETNIVVK